jgi:transglutaminase-like putative cysteine protease
MTQSVQEIRPDARARRGLPLNLHEGWVAGILLAIMLVTMTASVASANWTDGLWQATWAALGGLLFGALVARVRVNGFVGFVLAGIVGAAFVMWLVRGFVNAPPDASWNEHVILIEDRIDQWLLRVLAGGLGTDAFVFLCIMCAIAWFIGYFGAWFVFRHHQPWGAILPAGAALLINTFYAPPQSGVFLMVFLLAALLLLVRTTLLKRQATWATSAIRFANDIGLDFLVYGVIFSALIILLAWLIPPTMPGPAWFSFITDRARAPWQDFQDTMTRSFSTLRGSNNAAPTTYFGNSAAMGGPIRLGNREVFQVDAAAGQYWRAVVFDKYTGSGWTSTADQSAELEAADPRWKNMPMEKRRVVTQTVEVRLPTDNLVIAASQPLQVNQPVNAKFSVGRTDSGQTFLDMQSVRLQNALELGDQYIVRSSVSAADEASLRRASNAYPFYIRRTYMDVPVTVPPRVRALTLQITANAKNNYDKARAIETYLREQIAYNQDVDPIPQGADGVDYVLFERPEGYCNYYASAMAVMARIAGIPARVASGYAVGDVGDDGLYHINESNAHTWPELYFAELGWVEFEPTAARSEIVRPQSKPDTDANANVLERNQDENNGERGLGEKRLEELENQQAQNSAAGGSLLRLLGPNFGWSVAFVGILLTIALALLLAQLRWQKHLQPLAPGAQAVQEMYRFVRLIGLVERADATPDERAQALATRMPEARDAISHVNAMYVRERYGAYLLTETESVDARTRGIHVQKQVWHTAYAQHIGRRVNTARAWLKMLPHQVRAQVERFSARRANRG